MTYNVYSRTLLLITITCAVFLLVVATIAVAKTLLESYVIGPIQYYMWQRKVKREKRNEERLNEQTK